MYVQIPCKYYKKYRVFCSPVLHRKGTCILFRIKNFKCTYPVFKSSDDQLPGSRMQKCLCSCCFGLKISTTGSQYLPCRNYFEFPFLFQKSFPLIMTLRPFCRDLFPIKNHKKHSEQISNCIIKPAGTLTVIFLMCIILDCLYLLIPSLARKFCTFSKCLTT